MPDPVTLMQGLAALKTTFDTVRSAISMTRDVKSLSGGTENEKKAIDAALTVASSNAAIAEAQLAQAFDYELCRCDFPPTPMRTVGWFEQNHPPRHIGDPVYECPKCGFTSAGPIMYHRTVPERSK
jgi:hypothetical protein